MWPCMPKVRHEDSYAITLIVCDNIDSISMITTITSLHCAHIGHSQIINQYNYLTSHNVILKTISKVHFPNLLL